MTEPLRGGGGGKGRATKEKITFWGPFLHTFQNFDGLLPLELRGGGGFRP